MAITVRPVVRRRRTRTYDSEIKGLDDYADAVDQELEGKAPAEHTHALADIEQGAATADQVPMWTGGGWEAVTMSPSKIDGGLDLVVIFNNGVI